MESEKNGDIFGYKGVHWKLQRRKNLSHIIPAQVNIDSNKYQVSGIKRNFKDLMFQKLN